MSHSTHDKFIQHHGPVHSEPHGGPHAGTTYEGTDASVKMVLGSLGIIALTLVVTALLTIPIQNILRRANPPGNLPSPLAPARIIPKGPLLQVHPWNELPELRAAEDKQLSSSGADTQGHRHVAVEEAMNTVVSQLKIRPNAGPGLTVPGGQGRDFAGSLQAMPAPYKYQGTAAAGETSSRQPVVIQGEIRKNASPK